MSSFPHVNDVGISAATNLDEVLFNKLLSCPIKRKLVLNIIASEKDNIDEYKRKLVSKTPLKNVKKVPCESPTMLYRKRILEKDGKANSEVFSDNSDSRSSSRQSDVISLGSNVPSPELFDKLLEGVIAYVEVRSNSEDRSSGVKMLMKSMGATVRDKFTRDVTHVIFKDGSFMTYQKAKLLNVYLLSVLWIEAVRSSGKKVPEKKFPALGLDAYNQNVSVICSQMQKEYETIIKDELRKSMSTGTPLPSKRVLIDRRRTIMTPNLSNYSQSMGLPSSQDKEVAHIFKQGRKTLNFSESVSPELTSDSNSDLGAIIDGNIVTKNIDKTLHDNFGDLSSMDLTNIDKLSFKENTAPKTPNDSIYDKKTPKYKGMRCKKIGNSSSNIVDDSLYKRRTRSINSNDIPDKHSKLINDSLSNNLLILSKNECIASPNINNQIEDTSNSFVPALTNSFVPTLQLSSEKSNKKGDKSTSTNMSSLRISSGSNNINNVNANILPNKLTKPTDDVNKSDTQKNAEKSSSTNMSSLRVSSECNHSDEVDVDSLKKKLTKNVDYVNISKTSNSRTNDLLLKSAIAPNTENVSKRRKKTEFIETSPEKKVKIKSGTPMHQSIESESKVESVTRSTVSVSENSLTKISDNPKELHENITTRRKNHAEINNLHDKSIEETKVPPVKDRISRRQTKNSTKRKTIHTVVDRTPIKLLNKVFSSETKNKNIDDTIEPISKMLPNTTDDSLKEKISDDLLEKSPKVDEHVTTRKKKYRVPENSSNKNHKQMHNIDVTPFDEISGKPRELKAVQQNVTEAEITADLPEIVTKRRQTSEKPHTPLNKKKEHSDKNGSSDISDESLPLSRSTRRKTIHNLEEHKSTNTLKNDCFSESKSVKSSEGQEKLQERQEKKTRHSKIIIDNSHKKNIKERRVSVIHEQSNKSIGTLDKKATRRKTVHVLEETTPNNVNNKSSTSSTSESSGDNSGKKRRLRKLYNPHDSLTADIDEDEIQRQNLRQKAKEQKCDDEIFIQPNIISIKSNIIISENAKNYIENNNIDIEEILNREADDSESDAKKTRRNKKTGRKNSDNTGNDEQRELLKEVLKKKKLDNGGKTVQEKKSSASTSKQKSVKIDRRKSLRLTQMSNKKLNFSSSSGDEMHNMPVTPVHNRRSTMEFQTSVQMSANRKLKIDKLKRPSIVCTKLHKDQIQVFNQIVKKLEGFDVENEITEKSTHLVAGEPKRTINMLRAIARGCWVLKHEWLLKSLEADKWLPEEDFELLDFSPAVQHNRLQRQAFGPSFSMDIFHVCGLIYIARGSIPRCSDLRELVELCKGRITTISRNAEVVVGGFMKKDGVICLLETWILDSITNNKKMSYKKYIISSDNKVIL